MITTSDILDNIINDGSPDSFKASMRKMLIEKLGISEDFKFSDEINDELEELYDMLDPLREAAQKKTIKTEQGKTGEVTIYPFSEENKGLLLESGLITTIKNKIQSVIYNIANWLHESWLGQNFVPFGNKCGKVESWARYGASREAMSKLIPQLNEINVGV